MNIKSNKGYSLVEIGIALVIVVIFMTISVSLLSASNENYRIIEQKSTALSYAIKAIEAKQLDNPITEIETKAKNENNMTIEVIEEELEDKDGKYYGDKVKVITANVIYHVKMSDEGKTLTLKTLKINK